MTDYIKEVSFPSPFVPSPQDQVSVDPFGNLMTKGEHDRPGLGGGGGGGGGTPTGGIPKVDVRNGVTGAVILAGTETLVINGRSIYWVEMNVNNNGTAGHMLILGTLPY
jgi:hypothetical protein